MRIAAISAFCILALPPVALAHGGAEEHGYTSDVRHIVAARGVEAQASADGHFTLTAPTGHVVIVEGYEGEPYLRFAGGKIDENERAPTTYVNDDKPLPASASPKAPPSWKEIESGVTYTWDDHRTHWMAAQPPAAVQKAPGRAHHIFDWTVGGTVDGKPFRIVGSLDWGSMESGSSYEWISYLVIGGGVVYATFLILSTRKGKASRSRPLTRRRPTE